MSSTLRGSDRSKFDFYVTPIPAIRLFLAEAMKNFAIPTGAVLDPCAGGDATNPMSYPEAMKWLEADVTTLDIREDSRARYKGDYLSISRNDIGSMCGSMYPRMIISNPPFDLAIEFIKKALDDVAEAGLVIMLARLNFFGSGKRKAFWRSHMPNWTYVHSERMSFTPDGRTDSIEYAHLVWIKDVKPRFTQLRVI